MDDEKYDAEKRSDSDATEESGDTSRDARSGNRDWHHAISEDNETILIALDQISQTIDVMTSVVGRLRHFVEGQERTKEAELREAMRPDRTLH